MTNKAIWYARVPILAEFGTIDIRLHTDHSSRSVIHRAYRISHERQVDAILRLTASHLFHASDPFIG